MRDFHGFLNSSSFAGYLKACASQPATGQGEGNEQRGWRGRAERMEVNKEAEKAGREGRREAGKGRSLPEGYAGGKTVRANVTF